jgi:phage terminase small subunit
MAKPPAKKAAPKKAPAKKVAAKKVPAKKAAPVKRKVAKPPAPAPAIIDEDAPTAPDSPTMGLSFREAKFVEHYLGTHVVGQSYIDAGFTAKNMNVACAAGSRLLSSVKCRPYVAKRTKEMFARQEESQDRLIKTMVEVAYTDPNELVEFRRGSCRHCWGLMNRYQYTAGEWDAALERHNTRREALIEGGKADIGPLETKGGVGYDFRRDPNEDCPECSGMGTGKTIIKDTRNLSPGARSLYAGMKEGKDGLQALMHSQEKARDVLAKLLKLTDDSPTVNINLDPGELDEAYGKAMAESHARMAELREQRRKAREEGSG